MPIDPNSPQELHPVLTAWLQETMGTGWEVEALEIRDRHQRYGLHPEGSSGASKHLEPLVYVDVEHRSNPLDTSKRTWSVLAHKREGPPETLLTEDLPKNASSETVYAFLDRAATILSRHEKLKGLVQR